MPAITVPHDGYTVKLPGKATRRGLVFENKGDSDVFFNTNEAELLANEQNGITLGAGERFTVLAEHGEPNRPFYFTTVTGTGGKTVFYVEL